MSYHFTNTIEIEENDDIRLKNLLKILDLEYTENELNDRSITNFKKKGKKIIIEIKAKDVVALRSSINGAMKVLYTFNKISNLVNKND